MTSGDLADLIGQTKGDRSYAKLAQESGDVVIRQRWYQLATSPLKEFPEPPTIEAIARGLGVSVTDVVIACSRSVGLQVRDAGTFAGLDLAGVPDEQAEAVRRLVSTLRTEREESTDGTATSQAEVSSAVSSAVDLIWPRDDERIRTIIDRGFAVDETVMIKVVPANEAADEYLQESAHVGPRSAEHQDDYAKAAQATGSKTRANRQRRAEEKSRIPGEDQGEGSEGGA